MAAKKVDALEERLEGEMSQIKATMEDRISSVEDKVSDLHAMMKKLLENQIQTAGKTQFLIVVGGTMKWKSWRNKVGGMEEGMVMGGKTQGVLVGKENKGNTGEGVLILKKRGGKAKRASCMNIAYATHVKKLVLNVFATYTTYLQFVLFGKNATTGYLPMVYSDTPPVTFAHNVLSNLSPILQLL
ncbi:hypothetical protein M5K25_023157 [Dendrobium thyrsiflorum]|uniref:Uncharacterized protein n=1 Tax=Dendrobium thyrsiflorum TaxID=117978 RepID=A0ABD0UEC2_DENTH